MNIYNLIKIYLQTPIPHVARLTFLLVLLVVLSPANGQELEPRAYSNIPIGINFIAVGYAYTEGGVVLDPSVPLDNAHIETHGALFAFARSIKMGKMSGKIDVVLPYAWLSGSAEFQGDRAFRQVNGMGDSRFRISVNFIGAPPLSLSEFKGYKQKLIIGASLQVQVPTSQYDPTRLINIGTNRVTIRPELGISKTVKRFFLELAGGIAFYSTNSDFYNGKTRSQKPISSIQGHVIYTTKVGIWFAVDGNYYWGGKATVDGVEGNDLQKNSRLGITLALPVNIHHSLKVNYSTGVSTRTGSDFNLVAVAWQYRWSKSLPNKKS